MTQPTAKQVENVRMAYAIMAGFPAHKVDLGTIRDIRGPGAFISPAVSDHDLLYPPKGCSSVGCIAGVLSAHSYFKQQGLRFDSGSIYIGESRGYHNASNVLFGTYHLFDGGQHGLKGKIEALRRLRGYLWSNGRLTYKRNMELVSKESLMTE